MAAVRATMRLCYSLLTLVYHILTVCGVSESLEFAQQTTCLDPRQLIVVLPIFLYRRLDVGTALI
jgi:hypothetical protein